MINYKVYSHGKKGIYTSFLIEKINKKDKKGGASCQEEIEKEIDEPSYSWLQLQRILQNIRGKGIATITGKLLENDESLIVKVQGNKEAKREYEIQQKIKDISGIIEYKCFVNCGGDKKYIEDYGLELKPYQKVCNKKGSELGIIIMPYFSLGSFEEYLKKSLDDDKKIKVKDILCKSIMILYETFSKMGFTHGDFFSKNIVLKTLSDPILIDFERSSFNNNIDQFWRDIDDLLGDISFYIYNVELSRISREHLLLNRAYLKKPDITNISILCESIKNM